MSQIEFTREELYDRVWETPIVHLAPEFGLSDVGLRKLCHRHSIPTPPAGYWAKKEHGKDVQQIPLPPCDDGTAKTIKLANPKSEGGPSNDAIDEEFDFDIREALDLEEELKQGSATTHGHALEFSEVLLTQKSLNAASPDYQYHRIQSRATDGKPVFDVCVGTESVDRVMWLLEAISKGAIARGFEICPLDRSDETFLGMQILGKWFGMRINEKTRRIENDKSDLNQGHLSWHQRFDYEPTGELVLEFDHSVKISDTKTRRLEDRISEMFVRLIKTVVERRRQQAEHERREHERQALAERRAEQKRLAKLEEDRQREFHRLAFRFQEVRMLEDFLGAVRREATSRELPGEQREMTERWIQWAETYVDSYNPLLGRLLPRYDEPSPIEPNVLGTRRPESARFAEVDAQPAIPGWIWNRLRNR